MGYVIGETASYATWAKLRQVAVTNNTGNPGITGSAFNVQYPAGNYFLKTEEGNGFLRVYGFTAASFTLDKANPGDPAFFSLYGFVEPDNETLVGKLVSATGGTFTIEATDFTTPRNVGTAVDRPFTGVEMFEFLT